MDTQTETLTLRLKIWRQPNAQVPGQFIDYHLEGLSPDMSFLEMLDFLNEKLTQNGEHPVEFDSDCREGICGSCGLVVNGKAHGPELGAAICQVYLRKFKNQETLTIEPWRAKAFPVIKDLIVNRSALDRIITAGGYVSARAGPHPEPNTILIAKESIDKALDSSTCIQCGACVAACPNASAALFTGAQVTRFTELPQGQVESHTRVERLVKQMDKEGFGQCTNIGECEAACPKRISISVISKMRREYLKAFFFGDKRSASED